MRRERERKRGERREKKRRERVGIQVCSILHLLLHLQATMAATEVTPTRNHVPYGTR